MTYTIATEDIVRTHESEFFPWDLVADVGHHTDVVTVQDEDGRSFVFDFHDGAFMTMRTRP